MYFTHDNVARFMVEAVGLGDLTQKIWTESNHPDNRLPYIIDPACGSGTFLLHAMATVTSAIKDHEAALVDDHDSRQFYNARMSDAQPNYWAENFIYGFDPKFIMAITAKVNMVLHGDGSAHIFKEDAFKEFAKYNDARLRPIANLQRSINQIDYSYDICESFDVVLSNPPFGVTISSDVKKKINSAFSLSDALPSEGLFLERCFQLLKPGGRLALVLPQSLFNSKDMSDARLFLYRHFNIKAVVGLPRNIFIDTPTLTSLLFAEKKSKEEAARWDAEWRFAYADSETRVNAATNVLRKVNVSDKTAVDIASEFIAALGPLAKYGGWILKGGKAPAILKLDRTWATENGEEAAEYFKGFMRSAGFAAMRERYVFGIVSERFSYSFLGFEVTDVGYKLSKRKERAKPNQLVRLVGESGRSYTNLHLANEPCFIDADLTSPKSVLDHMMTKVTWNR